MTSIAVEGAASLVAFERDAPVRGAAFDDVVVHEHASVSCRDGRVVALDHDGDADVVVDARGCTVVPGFVDCHTHLPFYGWRADEDAARLAGERYESLHRGEGGIYRSARLLADASDDDVLTFSESLARAMLRRGTTTFETKSGYGLSVDAELRQLRLARALAERVPQTVVTTCLAAHAVPRGSSAGEWVGEAASNLLPRAAREGLASACDVYVESIAFALEHAARLAETARSLGMRMRMHADQLSDSQAGAFAARWGLASADHLNHTSADAAADIGASDTAAVLLPGATFTLRQATRPPARALIDAGAVVAVATDLNPGTSPVHSIPFALALACRLYGLRPLEALAGATVNAAYALGLGDGAGRIVPGGPADVVVLDVPSFDALPYRPDHDAVVAVVCGGELVHVAPGAAARVSS
ncbi:MAG TPA: imidazolonepropionase [Actinomycetota bacterium]|nr:imidazolonepropionase [Actinomycetota bacterium]